MVTLRNFTPDDAPVLAEAYPGMTVSGAADMVAQWNEKSVNSRYFEMFAVISDGEICGTLSLYQLDGAVISLGPEIFPQHRKKGLAAAAMTLAFAVARDMGYKTALHQVRADNSASVALHKKLGFGTDGQVYVNQKGRSVVIYAKSLV